MELVVTAASSAAQHLFHSAPLSLPIEHCQASHARTRPYSVDEYLHTSAKPKQGVHTYVVVVVYRSRVCIAPVWSIHPVEPTD